MGVPDNVPGEPGYVHLHSTGELGLRIERALAALEDCTLCPRACGADRADQSPGYCDTMRYARVSGFGAHLGEEACLTGIHGSGAIFFNRCNIACVFCQNFDISQQTAGIEAEPADLAAIMLELQGRRCHNINFVSPSHVVPQILEAMSLAIEQGLRLPLVYNSGGYDSPAALELLDGVIDIYMPDLKYFDVAKAERYLDAADYPDVARQAVRLMQRQVGDLVCDDDGIARRGLIVRHLVMPGGLEDTRAILRFLAEEISTDTFVNLMDQYRPANRVVEREFDELNRGITPEEWQAANDYARQVGLHRFAR